MNVDEKTFKVTAEVPNLVVKWADRPVSEWALRTLLLNIPQGQKVTLHVTRLK